MNFLVIGSGAREHALAWKLSQSSEVSNLWLWPGNAYTRTQFATLKADPVTGFAAVLSEAKALGVEAIVVGPEVHLAQGFADIAMDQYGIPTFGPRKIAAQLESSKAFAKTMMARAGIPTANFQIVHGEKECRIQANEMLKRTGGVVIKASGLAAGKGVFVCRTAAEIDAGVQRLYSSMMEAAETVVLEEILVGRECSFFCFLGEGDPLELGFAVDYKRLLDGDQGPNTGGMGCYTPVPWLPADAAQTVMQVVVKPLLQQMAKEDIRYCGCLYVGLMWTDAGPQVVEFNVRLGDPEAQVLCVADSRDWGLLFLEKLGLKKPSVARGAACSPSVCVVMASAGYPYGDAEKPGQSFREDLLMADENSRVFAASISSNSAGLLTGQGRVFSVIGRGDTMEHARTHAYQCAQNVAAVFTNARWRRDIAEKI